ncbi:MAG: hypothetical protein RL087_2047 [Pseudomonadota bacterium]|jgi:demethylmenaquinone methyltransferase/2-methoxy-6-polyprenyl-1,4-benzoquinol methylase
MTPEEREGSIRKYRRHAAGYDRSAQRTMALRREVIGLLQLRPGDVVLDVGAGTGLSYEWLLAGVQPGGRVLAFEQSPDMFARACDRAAAHGWHTDGEGAPLWHVCASAHEVQLPCAPDAILFNYTHDILRSREALAHLLGQARPGARVAVAGMKFFPWWTGPLNLLPWLKNRPYNMRAADMWSPWDRLAPWCEHWQRRSVHAGMGYVASGRLRSDLRERLRAPAAPAPGSG